MTEQFKTTELVELNSACAPAHDAIAVRAYHLWEKAGKPQSRELECWLQAEVELQSESQKLPEAVAAKLPIAKPKRKASRTSNPLKLAKTKRRFMATE